MLSLALGIGANTAIFSVASALLLQPLPYSEPDRLAILWNRSPGLGIAEDWFSTAQYFDIKDSSSSFEEVAVAIGSNVNLTGDGGEPERVGAVRVSSNLLTMIGARAEMGRLFTAEEDLEGAAPTAILHHGTWMRRYGGDPNVLEKAVDINGRIFRIVGVMPRAFTLPREVIRGDAADPASLAADARQAIRALDPDLPIYNVKTMQARVDLSLARRRFAMTLLALFGGLALGLAAIGTYGVMAYLVSQGTRELGIRMALGATPGRVARMVVGGGMTTALIGIAAGVAGAAALTRFMQTLLFEVAPIDPATFGLIALALAAIALVATYAPARRAAKIDPLVALRTE